MVKRCFCTQKTLEKNKDGGKRMLCEQTREKSFLKERNHTFLPLKVENAHVAVDKLGENYTEGSTEEAKVRKLWRKLKKHKQN